MNNQYNQSNNIEQEQLVGYWSKTVGLNKKQIDSNVSTEQLQAKKLAHNIIKGSSDRNYRLKQEEVKTLQAIMKKSPKAIKKAEMMAVFKLAKLVKRRWAKSQRKVRQAVTQKGAKT